MGKLSFYQLATGDLVVLGGNPLTCPEDEIKDLPVDLTIVGGRIVHERKSGAPGGS